MNSKPLLIKKSFFSIVAILFAFFQLAPLIAASDFDFYASDLITKESYRRISMDFKDASLKNILKVFSEQAGLNFIASESVKDRTVTLYMDNVPLQEALNKIMSANNLKYELDPGSNIFIVRELGRPDIEVITKIYNLKYARLKNSTLAQVVGSGASATSSSSASTSGLMGGGTSEETSPSSSSGTATGIEDSVKGVLTKNGNLMSDVRTNSLIITDIPSQFEVIDKVIALLDVATPQVMIEVEMLDVSKKLVDQMGVDTSGSLMSFTGASRQTRFPFHTLGMAVPPSAAPTLTYGTLSSSVFTAVLDLLSTDTKTKFLARPRILTLSNETAEIKITTNEAIGTIKQQSGEGTSSSSTESAERFETGISLKVTPQVDAATGIVTMYIQPVVSEAKKSTIVVNGQTVRDPETRSSTSTLMVKNGETIVVGGLIKTSDDVTVTKMPFLSDIPFVGALFRHKEKSNEERELIVFITPHILGGQEAMALAKGDPMILPTVSPGIMPYREQTSAVLRKEEIDNTLERWEN